MVEAMDNPRRPLYGRANQLSYTPGEWADPALVARKGQLYLLCAPELDPSVPAEVYRRYYTSPSFDVFPSLQSALLGAYGGTAALRRLLPVALVAQDLEIFILATDQGAALLVRPEGSQALIPQDRLIGPPGLEETGFYAARRRLNIGDMVVLTTREAAERLSWRVLQRTRGASASAAARALSRAAGGAPVGLLLMPGLAPVPELGPVYGHQAARAPAQRPPRPYASSPIWPALLLAAVAIGISLWIRRPALSRQTWTDLLVWMLTPVPTATPVPKPPPVPTIMPTVVATRPGASDGTTSGGSSARPGATISPTAQYPKPELISPPQGADVEGSALTLRWAWAGSLAEDEYFDVRLWREGAPKAGIAWTKERSYVERNLASGWHYWTVVVIQGRDGVVLRELCEEPKPISFHWQAEGQGPTAEPTSTPSPTPSQGPTRATPVDRPTRVTPVLTPTPEAQRSP